jgi:hypothetical protein
LPIRLDGGLNLNDPRFVEETELAIALNADFRQRGVVRSRDGRASIYTSQGTDLIGSADGDIYSVGSDIYRNGTALSSSITGVSALGVTKLRNVQNEVLLLSAQVNYKVDDSSVQTWGLVAPTVAPTLDLAAGTGLSTGDYYFKYTYVRKSGSTIIHESNPSPVSLVATTSGGNHQITVTCTASADAQVTHIRVYRTLVGGSSTSNDFYYDIEITLPTVAGTTANADSALGTLVEVDNDPPPATGLTAIAGPGMYNVIFIASGNNVYFSKVGRPESFPATYYVPVGVPYKVIKALIDWGGLIYIFTTDAVYFMQGTDPITFYPVRTQASRGLVAAQGIVATEKGILYISYDGAYAFNGQAEVKITSEKVDSLFRGETVNTVSPINKSSIANCWLTYFNGKMFLGYPSGSNTIPNKVLMYDFETFKFSIYDYGLNIKSVFVDTVNYRLLAGDNNGTVWQLETGEADGGTAFTFKVRSRELSGLTQYAPVLSRVDITNAGGSTVSARWLSKGTIKQTISLTDSVEQKRRIMKAQHLINPQLEIESLTSSRVEIGLVEAE